MPQLILLLLLRDFVGMIWENGIETCIISKKKKRERDRFCQQFSIVHSTGIPYHPQGQAIVERAHQTLKTSDS